MCSCVWLTLLYALIPVSASVCDLKWMGKHECWFWLCHLSHRGALWLGNGTPRAETLPVATVTACLYSSHPQAFAEHPNFPIHLLTLERSACIPLEQEEPSCEWHTESNEDGKQPPPHSAALSHPLNRTGASWHRGQTQGRLRHLARETPGETTAMWPTGSLREVGDAAKYNIERERVGGTGDDSVCVCACVYLCVDKCLCLWVTVTLHSRHTQLRK